MESKGHYQNWINLVSLKIPRLNIPDSFCHNVP